MSEKQFEFISDFVPKGDQPKAIQQLVQGLQSGYDYQTLLGVTGSGKTLTMAKVIAEVQRPTLVISHNKTLAAQLYQEFKEFFPNNAVEYFVSYFSYYQPEAYIPRSDTYIEKDSDLDARLERLRLSAMRSLSERRDVIIIASVSCIFGAGSAESWDRMKLTLTPNQTIGRREIARSLVQMQYFRNDTILSSGKFRIRGDVIDVYPTYDETAVRIELFGNEIDRLSRFSPLTGETLELFENLTIFPARHFVTPDEQIKKAIPQIQNELEQQLRHFRGRGKLVEAQRLEQRTNFDLEMLRETGYCTGIENYTLFLENRGAKEPPSTLLNYFPSDFLTFMDESHVMNPQLRGMYRGNRTRKQTLVNYGFRLPSALENRPLTYEEFFKQTGQLIFVSATPAPYERNLSRQIVEQVIRPTGLLDPEVLVKPTKNQIQYLTDEITARIQRKERILVTTLTKKMAEDLSNYFVEQGIPARYLHSEIDTLERVEILRDLRLGKFSVLVGINLLREGLDLPEVSLVAVLDADKEGFLRNDVSLIQTMGRASRNVNGRVILFADNMTRSMQTAIDETNRRREIQAIYNRKHRIVPQSIRKEVRYSIETEDESISVKIRPSKLSQEISIPINEIPQYIDRLTKDMRTAAEHLQFEEAAELRDQIRDLNSIIGGEDPL